MLKEKREEEENNGDMRVRTVKRNPDPKDQPGEDPPGLAPWL